MNTNHTAAFNCVMVILDEQFFYLSVKLYLYYLFKLGFVLLFTQLACFKTSRTCLTIWWFLGLAIEFAVKCGFAEYEVDATITSRIETIFRITQLAITVAILYWRYNCPETTDNMQAALLAALTKHRGVKMDEKEATKATAAPSKEAEQSIGEVVHKRRGRPPKT